MSYFLQAEQTGLNLKTVMQLLRLLDNYSLDESDKDPSRVKKLFSMIKHIELLKEALCQLPQAYRLPPPVSQWFRHKADEMQMNLNADDDVLHLIYQSRDEGFYIAYGVLTRLGKRLSKVYKQEYGVFHQRVINPEQVSGMDGSWQLLPEPGL